MTPQVTNLIATVSLGLAVLMNTGSSLTAFAASMALFVLIPKKGK